ncbi:hypothetical protein OB03_11090 [Brevundimonas sp. GN22]
MSHSVQAGSLYLGVSGSNRQEKTTEWYAVIFSNVQAFWAIEDAHYAALGGEVKTGCALNKTKSSTALDRFGAIQTAEPLQHYALLGGFMQYEVLSPYEPTIVRYDNEAAAVNAAQEVLK